MTQPSTGLQKALRAVGGDPWFSQRVEAACLLEDVLYTKKLATRIALDNADHIIMVEEPDVVDTTGITDEMIFTGINTHGTPNTES